MVSMIEIVMKLGEIRSLMMFNLILQCILFLVSPLRKSSSNAAVTTFLWGTNTLAALSADYTVGMLTHIGISSTASDEPLLAFLASFIVLHLVGPDNLTAFSMEDHKSLFRSGVRMLLTLVALSNGIQLLLPMNRLGVAAWLVFIAGFCKYILRMVALHIGNLTGFKAITKLNSVIQGSQRYTEYSPSEFFRTFKGVFANGEVGPLEISRSVDYFARIAETGDAFAVVETELNFAYDVLFTKAPLLLQNSIALFCNLFSVSLELAAFFIWVSMDKREFHKADVRLTYTLVTSSLALDAVSLLMMKLFSNWNPTHLNKFLFLKKKLFPARWSGYVPRYSLIRQSTTYSSAAVENALDWCKIRDVAYGFRNLSPKIVDDKLKAFIFNELKYRSSSSSPVVNQMSSARGDWILTDHHHTNALVSTLPHTWLAKSTKFDKIVLLCHVATELCYYSDTTNDPKEKELREQSKVISDYLAYLLVREQTMLSQMAGEAKATWEHTCDDVVKMLISLKADVKGFKDKERRVERACGIIVMADPDRLVEGVDEMSVLQGARSLSKELKGMTQQGLGMWELTSKVWAELLFYAAFNCKPSDHAAQLCKGGQLLTIVWLLMAHFGLTNSSHHPI